MLEHLVSHRLLINMPFTIFLSGCGLSFFFPLLLVGCDRFYFSCLWPLENCKTPASLPVLPFPCLNTALIQLRTSPFCCRSPGPTRLLVRQRDLPTSATLRREGLMSNETLQGYQTNKQTNLWLGESPTLWKCDACVLLA